MIPMYFGIEVRNGYISIDYKDVILFNMKTFDDKGYEMKQLNGIDTENIIDTDIHGNLIIDGVDEV